MHQRFLLLAIDTSMVTYGRVEFQSYDTAGIAGTLRVREILALFGKYLAKIEVF